MNKKPYEIPTLTRNGQLYSGVVIGGPLAGRMLTSATRNYRQAETPQMDLALAMGEDVPVTKPVTVHHYQFTNVAFPDNKGVNEFPMWLHDSVPTLADAFKILGDSYVETQRKK